jgi:hypothetical protein
MATTTSTTGTTGARAGRPISHRAVLNIYAVTIFSSAFLLFAIQPIFAKMVLPKLGGSPSVWAVSMCFFQAVLLAGYCYAHALNRHVPVRWAPLVHVCLLIAALFALPFGLPGDTTPPEGGIYLWLIGTLALGVGLPFFAISANAPLLQAWFARTGHPDAGDPYFLYAASNFGSLLALLAYPFTIEPMLGLQSQALGWTFGFIALALMISAAGFTMLALHKDSPSEAANGSARTAAGSLSWRDRAVFVGLSFVPSGLLVAFTTHVTTDIASVPLLWVVPLAAFLATFIVAFRDDPLVPDRYIALSLAPLVACALLATALPLALSRVEPLLMSFIAFVAVAIGCHRELYRRRPAAEHLTEFYLLMSLGGVLGGVFCSIVAPQIFNTVAEYPLLFVAGLVCLPGLWLRPDAGERRILLRIAGCTVAALAAAYGAMHVGMISPSDGKVQMLLLVTAVGFSAWFYAHPQRSMIACAGAATVLLAMPIGFNAMTTQRSFYGVVKVANQPAGKIRVMLHGTTLHGAELLEGADGKPIARPSGMTYYHNGGGMAQSLMHARQTRSGAAAAQPYTVGLVGLGVGSLACHARPGESWRYYEIDPLVVDIAKDPKYFSFLSKCPLSDGVVIGDARLTVQKEPSAKFDYLLIDAFSSDVVPVHLLTREAMAMYLDRLKPGGVLAFHVSSRFMDLDAVASVTASSLPGTHVARLRTPGNKTLHESPSVVVLVSRPAEAINVPDALKDKRAINTAGIAPWTDDYSDIVSAITRFWWRSR